jgi:hypothetical protein
VESQGVDKELDRKKDSLFIWLLYLAYIPMVL